MICESHLHLGTAILEPEFDLPCLKAKSFTELQSLLLIRVRTLLEKTSETHKLKKKRRREV